MVIISKTILNEFGRRHADAAEVLKEWYVAVEEADWKNLNEAQNRFNGVDYVGDNRFVFNIKGNHYRLLALIFFSVRTVYVKFIGTHAAAYDRVDVRTPKETMKINNELECKAAFVRLDALIAGDFEGYPVKEQEFTELALAIEAWEDRIPLMPIPVVRPPQTLTELLELTMFERKLKQRDLARLLDVPETRLSEVLRGKRKPNLDFIKRLHTQLGLDAESILNVA